MAIWGRVPAGLVVLLACAQAQILRPVGASFAFTTQLPLQYAQGGPRRSTDALTPPQTQFARWGQAAMPCRSNLAASKRDPQHHRLSMLDGFARAWKRVVSIQTWEIPGLIWKRRRRDSELSGRTSARVRARRDYTRQDILKIIEEPDLDEDVQLRHVSVLLSNFQQIFSVSDEWIARFARALLDDDTKLVLFFVDLDNVPRFFKSFSIKTLKQIELNVPCAIFVVCSSCQPYELKRIQGGSWNHEQLSRVHFTLANKHKDSADAVCAVAHAKLDSLIIASGRQADARSIICSEDKIFQQVDFLLRRGSSLSAIASKMQVAKPGNLFGLKLWKCECGRMFSSERAIDQHRAASHNARCRLEAAQRDSNATSWSLAGSAHEDGDEEPILRRRKKYVSDQRGGTQFGTSSPIRETLATLAAFVTTTLQRQDRGE